MFRDSDWSGDNRLTNKGLVSIETVVLRRWGSETHNFGVSGHRKDIES